MNLPITTLRSDRKRNGALPRGGMSSPALIPPRIHPWDRGVQSLLTPRGLGEHGHFLRGWAPLAESAFTMPSVAPAQLSAAIAATSLPAAAASLLWMPYYIPFVNLCNRVSAASNDSRDPDNRLVAQLATTGLGQTAGLMGQRPTLLEIRGLVNQGALAAAGRDWSRMIHILNATYFAMTVGRFAQRHSKLLRETRLLTSYVLHEAEVSHLWLSATLPDQEGRLRVYGGLVNVARGDFVFLGAAWMPRPSHFSQINLSLGRTLLDLVNEAEGNNIIRRRLVA